MLLLGLFLAFGWPKERTLWVPLYDARLAAPNLTLVRLPTCCGSMRPAIAGGETAYVTMGGGELATPGDIVATNVLHRVIAVTPTHIKTSGDNNRYSDPWVKRGEVKFIVRFIVRNP